MALQAALRQALVFTDDDLQANRAGRLSARQQRRLRRKILWLNMSYLALGGFFFAAAMYLEPWALSIDDGRLWTAVVIILLATAGVYHLLGESEAFGHDVRAGKVQRISGHLRCNYSEQRRGIQGGGDFYIQVHDQRFYVPWRVFDAFDDHQKYTLYFLPTVKRVVAAEPARWG